MIQRNITDSEGNPITNAIVADTAAADAWVASMAGYWPADFLRADVAYIDPQTTIDASAATLKTSATAKLKALGLTEAEVSAILGL